MKKNKKILSLIILIALILLMFLAGYTFARYYKSVKAGTAMGNIARWSFGAGNTEKTISLSDKKIAPGTNGNFVIEVDATNSEVGVDYNVQFLNDKNIPRNMKFYAETVDEQDNKVTTERVASLEELSSKISGTIPVQANNQKRIINVYWDWEFNENDTTTIDNEDGTLNVDSNGNPILDSDQNTSLDCVFDVEIVGKQQKVS